MNKVLVLAFIFFLFSCDDSKERSNHKIYKIAVIFQNGDKDTLIADIFGNPNEMYVWNGNLHYWKSSRHGVLARDTRLASYVRSFKILDK